MLADDRSTAWEDAATHQSSAARSWTWSRPDGRSPRRWGTSAQSISTWRRQDRIDNGLTPALSSPEKQELAAARRRIAQLETELAITRRAAELLKEQAPPFDGSRPSSRWPPKGSPSRSGVGCRVVSQSGFYAWRSRAPSARAIRHAWLTDAIRQVYAASRQTYGSRRVHAELTLGRGISVGDHAVELPVAPRRPAGCHRPPQVPPRAAALALQSRTPPLAAHPQPTRRLVPANAASAERNASPAVGDRSRPRIDRPMSLATT
jgi:hypothetical protein